LKSGGFADGSKTLDRPPAGQPSGNRYNLTQTLTRLDGKPGTCHLKLGLYDTQTGSRAQFLGTAGQPVGNHVLLPDVVVKP